MVESALSVYTVALTLLLAATPAHGGMIPTHEALNPPPSLDEERAMLCVRAPAAGNAAILGMGTPATAETIEAMKPLLRDLPGADAAAEYDWRTDPSPDTTLATRKLEASELGSGLSSAATGASGLSENASGASGLRMPPAVAETPETLREWGLVERAPGAWGAP
jgi:hypothetical protein